MVGWSNLLLSDSKQGDSGNYSCRPSNARPDTVTVTVISGNIYSNHDCYIYLP